MNYQDMNIKNPTFGGFKPDAMSRIAKTLGYEGEMSGFQQYLDQNPDKRTQMDQFKQAAMMMAKGGSVQKFNEGGQPSTAEEYTASMQKQYGTDSPSYLDSVTGGAYSTTLAGFNNQGTQQPEPTQPVQPKLKDSTLTLPQPLPVDPRTGKPPEFVGGPALPVKPPYEGIDDGPYMPRIDDGIPPVQQPKTPSSKKLPQIIQTPQGSFNAQSRVVTLADGTSRQEFTIKDSTGKTVATLTGAGEFADWMKQNEATSYDPSQGMPEPLSEDVINQYTTDVPSHFNKELKEMFTSGKLPTDPTDYTISGGSRNWTITYADGTTIKNRARRRSSVENDAENIIPNYINTFKESPEYTQNKAQQDAYREYLTGEASRGVTEDIENIEQRYNEINDQYRQADLELRRLQAQAEDNPDDPYLKALVEEKGQELSDLYDRQQQLTTLYREQRAAEEAKLPTIEDVMKGRATDPTLPEGAKVEAQKIQTAPDQFIAEGTGQVTGDISYTAKQGQVTKSAGVEQPATATYDATKVTDKAKAELAKAQAATGTLSPDAVIEAQEGELSPAAMAEAQMFDDQRLSLVPTDPYLKVDKNQLAEAKGNNLDAVKAQVAQSDMLEKAVAETATVQPEELPPPAQIAEDQIAQAEIMTMEGLTDDATAVAAKLEKFTVDDGTLALAMQGDVDALDTVEGQLSQLMKDFDDGTPAWAAGAIRAANAAMAARGLGASSMAGAAVLQAAMESALPIAQQDAATFANMNMANLNNRQQTALSNAAAQQGLQLQNLSNEQAAALANSANAFALQSQNLSNMQSVVIANAQIKSALQGENLSNEQQSNLAIAARFAEVSNLNLTNKQQTALQNNASQLQTNLANLSSKSQAYITNANLEASLQGQVLSNEQQVAINNAARFSEASNITFSAEQQAQLHNSSLMQTIGLAELSSAQAATLQNAAQIASMDMANLNNRQQAAVENAKSFLQMDLTNLSNEQQMAVFKAQATQQALLSDQAAENAAKQFNAQSENQANQFFANLKQQNNQFNAAQANAMEQFNVGQENAAAQFNAEMKNNREQFNAQNELVVAQSNAQWRREVATADTAAQNRANELNAINTLDISNQAYDNMWNMYGDQMEWAVNSYEKEADRVNALTLETMRQEGSEKAAKYAADSKASSAIGGAVVSLLTAGSDPIIGNIFG